MRFFAGLTIGDGHLNRRTGWPPEPPHCRRRGARAALSQGQPRSLDALARGDRALRGPSGVKPASDPYEVAYETPDRMTKAMTYLPARTLAGVVAKTRIALGHVSGLFAIEERTDGHIRLSGADDDTRMLSILRDLVTMGDTRAD